MPLEDWLTKIKACHRSRDLPGAVQCYSSILNEFGQSDDPLFLAAHGYVCSILIDLCAKLGDCKSATQWMKTLIDAGVHPSRIAFNCLANAHAQAGDIAGAEEVFAEMNEWGILPDPTVYNCILRALVAKGCAREVEVWFEKTKHEDACDSISYQLMLDHCVQQHDAQRAAILWVERGQLGLHLDREAFRAMMAAYASEGNVATAESWCLKAREAGFVPRVHEYTLLLMACAPTDERHADTEKGKLIFCEQIRAGIEPDHKNLAALAGAVGGAGARSLCKKLRVDIRSASMTRWAQEKSAFQHA